MSGESRAHETVLLAEAVSSLVTQSDGLYVDATFGRGGHSREILAQLSDSGRLAGIDKDPEAISYAKSAFQDDPRFEIYHGSFAEIEQVFPGQGLDGVLADLGVSSPQLDQAERGFSFMRDGPLDMRMNTESGESAAQWLAREEPEIMAKVFWEYGEEKFSRRIASAIAEARVEAPITTTLQLAKLIESAVPVKDKHKHPATRCFQAIRIHINNELGDLESLLEKSVGRLKVGGRLVVISFHSLEDRIVKRFMKKMVKGAEPPPGVPIKDSEIKRLFRLSSKAIKPGKDELAQNVRARSAVMRSLEKIANE